MRVCIVGSGGREHALAHVLARTADVVVTPGNPGMAPPITVVDEQPVEEIEADLYVIGPEAPLVAGLADTLRAPGPGRLGPGADGALLEGSKAFMKEVLERAGVPTARFATFDALESAAALDYLETLPGPWVIKTDGLAGGKGVLVAHTLEEAREDVGAKLSGATFGDAGRHIVIEEGMEGEECSLLVALRRDARGAARAGAGLQADRRRRRRPQYRRHGCATRRCPTWAPTRSSASWTRPCGRSSRSCAGAASTIAACSTPASC